MSVTRNVLWKRPGALGTILFCVRGGVGVEEPLFPKAPKPFSEKASPRISATAFTGSAETCQLYFQAIYKSKIERIRLNGLSRVAKPLIIGAIWLGIYRQPIFEAVKR